MTRALVALLALPVALPALAAEPEVVKLRFAWPAPAEAQVTYSRERTRTGKEPSSSKISYVERIERRGDELWTFSGGVVAGVAEIPGLPPGESAAAAAELARAAEGLARVVGVDGNFRRLEGVDQAWPVIVGVVERRLPAGQREVAGRAMQAVKPALPVESQSHWAFAVTSWAGKELELGAEYEATSRAESPLAPGHPVTYQTRLRAARRVPCQGNAAPRCVELLLESAPDPSEIPGMVEAMTRRILAQAAPGAKAPEGPLFKDVSMSDAVRLVTDPATLLPRSLSWTRRARLTSADGRTMEQRDERWWTYAWKGQEQ